MYWGVVVFETLCWLVFFSMLGTFTYLSYKRGRILPGLWFVLSESSRCRGSRRRLRQRHVCAVSPRLPPAPGNRADRHDLRDNCR